MTKSVKSTWQNSGRNFKCTTVCYYSTCVLLLYRRLLRERSGWRRTSARRRPGWPIPPRRRSQTSSGPRRSWSGRLVWAETQAHLAVQSLFQHQSPGFSTTFGATFSKLGFDAVTNWGLNWWGRRTLNWFWIQSRRGKKKKKTSSAFQFNLHETKLLCRNIQQMTLSLFHQIRFLIRPFGYYHILNLSWFDEGGSV